MNTLLPHRICSALIAAVLGFAFSFAGSGIEQPAKFKLVTNLSELAENGKYLIGGLDAKGGCFLMSGKDSPDRKFRRAIPVKALNRALDIGEDMSSCIWTIKPTSKIGYVYLLNCNYGKYLSVSKKSATALLAEDNIKTPWYIESFENSKFLIKTDPSGERMVAAFNTGEKGTRFGNYIVADVPGLYIYKFVENISEMPAEATLPTNGETVAIYAHNKLVGATITSTVDSEGYILSDSKVAHDKSLALFKCQHSNDGLFSLEISSGTYLSYDLKPSKIKYYWQIYNGRVITNEKSPRTLVVKDDRLTTLPDGKFESGMQMPVFLPVGSETKLTKRADGIVCLEGAWSSRELMNIDWTDVSGLDLTAISIPITNKAFTHYPQSTNAMIYVAESNAEFVPKSWHLAVACAEKENYLIHDFNNLTDDAPFYTDRKIRTYEGQLTYTRIAYNDGYWETLCLPFDASLPSDYYAESLERESDDTFFFAREESVHAGQPLIMRFAGQEEEIGRAGEVSMKSHDCYISCSESSNPAFLGTYSNILVKSPNEGMFFLNPSGNAFVLADANSFLKPFRAYLKDVQAGSKTKSVVHAATPTAIKAMAASTGLRETYDLSGRRIHLDAISRSPHSQFKGIYIINGKKVIK